MKLHRAVARRCWIIATLLLVHTAPLRAEWVEWVADATAEYRYNSNVNRSAFSADEESDSLLSGRLALGRIYELDQGDADYTRLRITGDLELRAYDEFTGLNRINPGLSLDLTHKFSLGWRAPWVNLHGTGLYESVDDSDRDKSILNAGVRLGKRFTERFDGSIDWSYDKQDGKDDLPRISPGLPSNVYDLERSIFSARTNYQLSERVLGSLTYAYLDGDINGECTAENVGAVIETITIEAHTLDSVFGGCRYSFDGHVNTLGVSGSYAVNPHASINLGAVWSEGGRGALLYRQNQFFVNFFYSY